MAPKKNSYWSDPAKEAMSHLDSLIDAVDVPNDVVVVDEKLRDKIQTQNTSITHTPEVSDAEIASPSTPEDSSVIDIKNARTEGKVLEVQSKRQQARILFFIKDESILHEGSPTFKRITDLRHTFSEVHVVLLKLKSVVETPPTLRFFDAVWVYTTDTTSWWKLSFDAYRLAEQQLVFAGGFRADIIVVEDTFEAGLAGWFIAKRFQRPIQAHLYEDFFDDAYIQTQEHPTLYAWSTHYLLNHFTSVRTKTEMQRRSAIEMNASLEQDAEILPNYYNLSAWRDFVPTINLRERYPQFKFIVLHISAMQKSSHTDEVIQGTAMLLRRYPTIGLVIVGNGPLRTQFEKQAIALGLQNQIEFEPMPSEILSHLKSAHILVHLSDDSAEDDIILSAASVKIPTVLNGQGLSGKLFVDGESTRLCHPTDITCVTDSINMYLNDNLARTQYTLKAYDTVFERIEQDYQGYLTAYAQSIERSLQSAQK